MAADGIQLASAVIELAKAVRITIHYAQRLYQAPGTAGKFHEKVTQLDNVVLSIKNIVDINDNAIEQGNRRVRELITDSANKCHVCITAINVELDRLINSRGIAIAARMRFVWKEKMLRRLENDIEAQLQNAHILLNVLNTIITREHFQSSAFVQARQHEEVTKLLLFIIYFLGNVRRYSFTEGLGEHHQTGPRGDLRQSDTVPSQLFLPAPQESSSTLAALLREPRTEPTLISAGLSEEQPRVDEDLEEGEQGADLIDEARCPLTFEMPLSTAVSENEVIVVKSLLNSGVVMTNCDANGWTLLHHAIFHKAYDVLKVLLNSSDASSLDFLNQKNRRGQTALVLASEGARSKRCYKMAVLLLSKGCDPNVPNRAGQMALDIVNEAPPHHIRERFAELLLENGASVENLQNLSPRTGLRYEVVRNHVIAHRRASAVSLSSTGSTDISRPPISRVQSESHWSFLRRRTNSSLETS